METGERVNEQERHGIGGWRRAGWAPVGRRVRSILVALLAANLAPAAADESPRAVAERWWAAVWQRDGETLRRLMLEFADETPVGAAWKARRARVLLPGPQPPPGRVREAAGTARVEWPLPVWVDDAGRVEPTLTLPLVRTGDGWRVERVVVRIRATAPPAPAGEVAFRCVGERPSDAFSRYGEQLGDLVLERRRSSGELRRVARAWLAWHRLAWGWAARVDPDPAFAASADLAAEFMGRLAELPDAVLVRVVPLIVRIRDATDRAPARWWEELESVARPDDPTWWEAAAWLHAREAALAFHRREVLAGQQAIDRALAALGEARARRRDSRWADLMELEWLSMAARRGALRRAVAAARRRYPDSALVAFYEWRVAPRERQLVALQRWLAFQPGDPQLEGELGLELARRRRFAAAIPRLELACAAERDGGDPHLALQLGFAYLFAHRPQEARATLTRLLQRELDPEDLARARIGLALAYLHLGDYRAATALLRDDVSGLPIDGRVVIIGLVLFGSLVWTGEWLATRRRGRSLTARFGPSECWWPLLVLAIGQGVLPLLGIDLLAALALSFVGMLVTTLWVVYRRKGMVAWLPLRDRRWRQRLPGAIVIVLLMLVASELVTRGVDAALALALEEEAAASLATTSQIVEGFLQGLARTDPLTFAAVFLIVAVIGPTAEEVYFRGLLFGSLMERKGRRYAIGMSALYFALLHLHPIAIPAIFAIGLLLAWLVDRTDSLALPITLHVLNNAAALLIARYG